MARYDDLHTGTITLVGVISAILTFVIIVAAQVLYYKSAEFEHQRKMVDAPLVKTEEAIASQEEELSSYSWIDRDKNLVSTPIDQAMTDVLAELSGEKKAAQPEQKPAEEKSAPEDKPKPEAPAETETPAPTPEQPPSEESPAPESNETPAPETTSAEPSETES